MHPYEIWYYQLAVYSLALLFGSVVKAQSYPSLPPAPSYSVGVFLTPNTSTTQIYSKDASMNVSWSTTYQSVNLYLIYDGNFNTPITCITGSAQAWWMWTVDDHGNNTAPFAFRAVNAKGTQQDQLDGGFYTGQFWVKPNDSQTSTSLIATAGVVSTISTLPSTSTSSAEVSSSRAASSDAVIQTSLKTQTVTSGDFIVTVTATSLVTSIASSTATGTDPIATSTIPGPTAPENPLKSPSAAIGPAVGGGCGLGIIMIAGCFCWRRSRRHNHARHFQAHSQRRRVPYQEEKTPAWSPPGYASSSDVRPYELRTNDLKSPVEVGSSSLEPSIELPSTPVLRGPPRSRGQR